MEVMNGMTAERTPKIKRIPREMQLTITTGTIMNIAMVEQIEESIDIPKTMNLPLGTGIAAVAEPGTANLQIAKNIIKWIAMKIQQSQALNRNTRIKRVKKIQDLPWTCRLRFLRLPSQYRDCQIYQLQHAITKKKLLSGTLLQVHFKQMALSL
jgi:hypothetical protein